MTTNFQRNSLWFATAGKTPNPKDASVQYGVHLEEIAEMLDETTFVSTTGITSAAMQEVSAVLKALGENLKLGHAHIVVHDKAAFLDALCDQGVTGDGVAYLMGFDKDGADKAVIDANFDKFVDGVPVIKPGGKIGKREGWVAPDLTPFVPVEVDVVDAEVPHVPV